MDVVVCYSLFVVRCSLFVVCCLLQVLMLGSCRLLLVVCWFGQCCFVFCRFFGVFGLCWCLLFVGLSFVVCLLSFVVC